MGLIFQNLPGVFSFLLIHSLSFASSRATRIDILNSCTYTVWAAAYPGGGKQLKQGEKWTLSKITGSGRIWGRTKCAFGHDGRGKCETGDCDGDLECQTNGRAPNTLGEYSINQAKRNDIFYISVVEGFNIPMEFRPAASSSPSSNCSSVSKCAADVNGPCPMELRDPGGCNNPCTVFSNSQFCCTSGLSTCGATSYSKFFKDLCLYASTYPSDVAERNSCPTGIDYNVVFCPPNEPEVNNEIVTRAMFDQMLKHRNDNRCPGNGFYTYEAFVTAATSFNGFGNEGNYTTRKRELAAFFGQTSHETTGGWTSAPDGPYAWGYCYVRENGFSCADVTGCYYGRGPFQLTWDFNYKAAGEALGIDLINDPDLVAMDPVVSFKTAIWFWMTPQGNRPSSHDIIVGRWTPSSADRKAGRVPGYGAITNIINGANECGRGHNGQVVDRIGFYKRYCDILGVAYGDHLDCYTQQPFA